MTFVEAKKKAFEMEECVTNNAAAFRRRRCVQKCFTMCMCTNKRIEEGEAYQNELMDSCFAGLSALNF